MDADQLVTNGCDAADAGDHERAADLFRRAIAEGESWAALNLGNSLVALGREDEAAAAFLFGWRQGEDADAGYNFAKSLARLERGPEAKRVLEELASSGYVKAMIDHAWNLSRDGDMSSAIELVQSASGMDDDYASHAAAVAGHWMWVIGQEGAEQYLQRGKHDWEDARTDLIDLLESQGRSAEAAVELEEGVDMDEVGSLMRAAGLRIAGGDLVAAKLLLARAAKHGDRNAADNLEQLNAEAGR